MDHRRYEFLPEPSPQAESTIAVIDITVPTMPSESPNADIILFLMARHHLSEYDYTTKIVFIVPPIK